MDCSSSKGESGGAAEAAKACVDARGPEAERSEVSTEASNEASRVNA